MDRCYTLKVIGGALILTLLLCAGIHFYAKWEYQRFAEELGEAPTFDASPETCLGARDAAKIRVGGTRAARTGGI